MTLTLKTDFLFLICISMQDQIDVYQHYFCSELAADALKHLGAFSSNINPGHFLPGDFLEKTGYSRRSGYIERYMKNGFSLSQERIIIVESPVQRTNSEAADLNALGSPTAGTLTLFSIVLLRMNFNP
jgi:hypothetical protein